MLLRRVALIDCGLRTIKVVLEQFADRVFDGHARLLHADLEDAGGLQAIEGLGCRNHGFADRLIGAECIAHFLHTVFFGLRACALLLGLEKTVEDHGVFLDHLEGRRLLEWRQRQKVMGIGKLDIGKGRIGRAGIGDARQPRTSDFDRLATGLIKPVFRSDRRGGDHQANDDEKADKGMANFQARHLGTPAIRLAPARGSWRRVPCSSS